MKEAPKTPREDNPFEDKKIAKEWISSVEGEGSGARQREIYPLLSKWASAFNKDSNIIEIGSGQGICSEHLGTFKGTYVGVEPSEPLTERANKLYGSDKTKKFVLGNAYSMPATDESADGVFSLNVWFHLAELGDASQELARILKKGGAFNIITTNPESYNLWRTFFEDYTETGKVLSGKVNIPVNPLSRNDFYMHTMNEMLNALQDSGLTITSTQPLGTMSSNPDEPLFISIQGVK